MSLRWDDDRAGELDDEQAVRVARGVAQVDRACTRYQLRSLFEPRIPICVAIAIGWPLCGVCRRPIVPWQAIRWHNGDFHPSCAYRALKEMVLVERGQV